MHIAYKYKLDLKNVKYNIVEFVVRFHASKSFLLTLHNYLHFNRAGLTDEPFVYFSQILEQQEN